MAVSETSPTTTAAVVVAAAAVEGTERSVPPRSGIDLAKGTAFIVVKQEADGPCADGCDAREGRR
ncbi:hypothetical protein ACWIG5_31655 [Streptomyces lydicus]